MAESNPSVSVIIPSYNCERYIAETMESVLNQSFKDIELIVVDDGSTDNTREIVESFGHPVRLITQENARVCAARNHGLRQSRGKYICFMDHDDYWFPHKLETQLKIMENHPEAGVVYSEFLLWHPDRQGKWPSPSSLQPEGDLDAIDPEFSGWIYHQFLLDCWMLTSTAMFRKEVFEKCGDFDVNLPYSEDWDLWLRISREFQFIKLIEPNTLYRQHPEQGNRKVRDIDYRTVLLEKAVKKWGYCSPDGRCTEKPVFLKKLAHYHAAYGLHQLQAGNTGIARRSFLKAWRNNPLKPKYLAYIAASMAGWKPSR